MANSVSDNLGATMNHGFLFGLLIVIVSMATPCQGSKIVLTATPANVTEGLTKSLTVRCALQNDTSSTSTVTRLSTITLRKVFSKAEDSAQREVGKIVSGQAAVAGAWATGASVTGALSNTEGHLQATWSDPGPAQAGGYSCEIVALEADGTNIKFKSNVQVESTTQTVADLTRLISQSKDEIATLKKAFSDDIATLQKTVNDLKVTTSNLSPPHAEEGIVQFEASTTWGENFKYRERVKEVLFAVPYARIPQVNIALVVFDDESHTRYQMAVRDLTTTGFKLVCASWWDSLIYGMWVRWTSSVA